MKRVRRELGELEITSGPEVTGAHDREIVIAEPSVLCDHGNLIDAEGIIPSISKIWIEPQSGFDTANKNRNIFRIDLLFVLSLNQKSKNEVVPKVINHIHTFTYNPKDTRIFHCGAIAEYKRPRYYFDVNEMLTVRIPKTTRFEN